MMIDTVFNQLFQVVPYLFFEWCLVMVFAAELVYTVFVEPLDIL